MHALMPRNNLPGNNQHGGQIVYPDEWPTILQGYRDQRLSINDIKDAILKDHNLDISKRTLERQLSLHTSSVRKPSHDINIASTQLIVLIEEDPHRRLGARVLQERLATSSIHVPRDFISHFLSILEPAAVQQRRPGAQKIHRHGLHSLGPNEEWSVDGHDKIRNAMRLDVWGVVDKYSRLVLGHFVVPNNRLADTVLACFILLVKRVGGIPLRVVADKGSETDKIHAVQVALRSHFAPDLLEEELPAFKHVTSKHNITVERQWQPLFKKCLANILVFWLDHKGSYHEGDHLHQEVARFLWAKIVQLRLDRQQAEDAKHKIRKQKNRLLPTGGQPQQFYDNPEDYGGVPFLIPISTETLDRLVEEYVPQDLFHFCAREIHDAATTALRILGEPSLVPEDGWNIFSRMIVIVRAILDGAVTNLTVP